MAKLHSLFVFALLLRGSAAFAQGLRPGDRLAIRTLGAGAPFADTAVVSEQRTIVLPKVGTVDVANFPLATLGDSVRDRLSKYVRNPAVDVIVLRRIVINGEVKRPDIYYVDLSMTLPDAIAHAGGTTEAANNKVSIRRGGQMIPVADWQTSKASVASLQSGDQIIVGRRPWIVLNFLPAVSTAVVVGSLIVSLRR